MDVAGDRSPEWTPSPARVTLSFARDSELPGPVTLGGKPPCFLYLKWGSWQRSRSPFGKVFCRSQRPRQTRGPRFHFCLKCCPCTLVYFFFLIWKGEVSIYCNNSYLTARAFTLSGVAWLYHTVLISACTTNGMSSVPLHRPPSSLTFLSPAKPPRGSRLYTRQPV